MNWSLAPKALLVILALGFATAPAQEPSADQGPKPEAAVTAQPSGEKKGHVHADGTVHDHDHDHDHGEEAGKAETGMPEELPEGYQEEYDRRLAVFQGKRDELEKALFKQRQRYILYTNREDRTPAARKAFYAGRQQVREILDETFEAALDTMRMGIDQEAATFVVTMVQHRFQLDIYNRQTLEATARLIDGGSRLTYIFQSGARSAVVSGDFDLAKRMLDAIDDDQMEEIDQTLEYLLDVYREAYEAEQVIREKEAAEDRLPRVLLKTTQGDVVVELFIDQAPSAVSNFIKLVEEGYYEDLDFYQVIDHMLALCGDAAGDGTGNTGRYLLDEHTRPDARKAFRGSLVMAKLPKDKTSGEFIPNSASSQFAILYLPIISISEQQTVFGRVIEGMDAICRLRRVDPSKKKSKGKLELPPDRIIEAKVIRRPDVLPEPVFWAPGR